MSTPMPKSRPIIHRRFPTRCSTGVPMFMCPPPKASTTPAPSSGAAEYAHVEGVGQRYSRADFDEFRPRPKQDCAPTGAVVAGSMHVERVLLPAHSAAVVLQDDPHRHRSRP